jgi:hypothetical protein
MVSRYSVLLGRAQIKDSVHRGLCIRRAHHSRPDRFPHLDLLNPQWPRPAEGRFACSASLLGVRAILRQIKDMSLTRGRTIDPC